MEALRKQQFRRPRVYADVHTEKSPRDSFTSFKVTWESANDYSLISRLGKGKYSEVFEANNDKTNERCVIKVLKPVRKKTVSREIRILEMLKGGPNIIQFQKAIMSKKTAITSLVFEHFEAVNWFQCMVECPAEDVKFYLYETLRALDYCHSKGIIHRDVKPHNIVIDPVAKKLKLIDWGLAELYVYGLKLNTKVASRYFKGPELLVGYCYYDYSLDLWSFGCILAAVIFRRDPFFRAKDNKNQLRRIVKFVGTEDFKAYLQKYSIKIDKELMELVGVHRKQKWDRLIHAGNVHLVTTDALNLIGNLLVIDHSARLTAKEAMNHKYFDSVRPKPRPTTHTITSF